MSGVFRGKSGAISRLRRSAHWLALVVLTTSSTACALAPGLAKPEYPTAQDDSSAVEFRSVQDYLRSSPGPLKSIEKQGLQLPIAEPYLIGVGDMLSVIVWNHPSLSNRAPDGSPSSNQFSVGSDGTFFFPFAGTIRAAGNTAEAVRQELTRRLAPFVKTPQVSVQVETYVSQQVYIVGQVERPGLLALTGRPLTVIEALARAGGLKPTASLGPVQVVGAAGNRTVDLHALLREGDMTQNIQLRAGDVLQVPDNRREKVFVLGEVRQPQSVGMVEGTATLAEALVEAGGPNPATSDPSNVYVLRGSLVRPTVFHLDMGDAGALLLADRFELEPRDIVFVSTAPVTRWNRVLSQIIPSLQTLFYMDSLAR